MPKGEGSVIAKGIGLSLLGILSLVPGSIAGSTPLLPRPQQVQYGAGRLPLAGLSISLPNGASAEDWYAANHLAACLSAGAATRIPVIQDAAHGPVLRLQRTGAVDALPRPGESPGPQSREEYSIQVAPGGGKVQARSSAGLFYGSETLCQLGEGDPERATLPAVEIHDWPALAYRGVLVDMSEGPLPTVQEIKRQIAFLAGWKVNQYYFYNEANIELKGYPLLNPGACYSQSDIRSIVAYARKRHIDVIPALELYGHLHDLFRIEKYSGLADFPHGGEFNPRNPKVMKLLTDWTNQFSALFPSPFVHIGFDETWQIQKAAQQQTGTSPVSLFVTQLGNVARLFESHGKQVMAWEDIMVKYPGIISKLPPGLIAVAWYYEPYPDPTYEHWLGPLIRQHIPHMIAPAVHSWNEISPDLQLTFENIDTFLAAGRKSGAMGMINTLWTDDSQMLMRMSWPGLAYGAAAAWQTAPMNRERFLTDYATLTYKDQADVAAALRSLAQAEVELQQALGQSTMVQLWDNPFSPRVLKVCRQHREDLHEARLLSEDAEEHLDRALAAGDNPLILNSLAFGSRLLDYAGMRYLYALEIAEAWKALSKRPSPIEFDNNFIATVASQTHGRLPDLMDTITTLKPLYRQEWLAEYYRYRMSSALGRWDAEYEYWRALQTKLKVFANRFHVGDSLPELQSLTGEQ